MGCKRFAGPGEDGGDSRAIPSLDVVEYEETGVPKKWSKALGGGSEEPVEAEDVVFFDFLVNKSCWEGREIASETEARVTAPFTSKLHACHLRRE